MKSLLMLAALVLYGVLRDVWTLLRGPRVQGIHGESYRRPR